MEVINDNSVILTNYEVFKLLNDIQSGTNGQKKPTKHQQHLATISYSTLKYLEKTPCAEQNTDTIAKFVQSLQPFNLTKSEKIQLVNHRPKTAVEIQLMIEESEERLTEEQIGQLLDLINTHLPGDDTEEQQDMETEEANDA